jgi:hypothetical protein
MILGPLLLGVVCGWPLEFGLTGRYCEQPHDPCRCSQAIQWDREVTATGSEVWRREVGGTWAQVGTVPLICTATEPSLDPEADEICIYWEPRCYWLPLMDEPMPNEGMTYEYTIVHVNDCGRSQPGSSTVAYVGPPVACFEGGVEVECYPGDPLMRPVEVAPARAGFWRRLFGLPPRR